MLWGLSELSELNEDIVLCGCSELSELKVLPPTPCELNELNEFNELVPDELGGRGEEGWLSEFNPFERDVFGSDPWRGRN